MKVILPMAGNGQRFFDDGYDLPKPLIDIKGKPMFKRVVDNLHLGNNVQLNCIVRQDHVDQYNIDQRIKEYYENANVLISPGPTEGAACTVRLATSMFGGEAMMVANCDGTISTMDGVDAAYQDLILTYTCANDMYGI